MNHLVLAAAALALAGCYQPIVVKRENDPGPYTLHPRSIPIAAALKITLQERPDLELSLDGVDGLLPDTSMVHLTVTNHTHGRIGYFEVRCREFDAKGHQIAEDYSNLASLDPDASQPLQTIYLPRIRGAVEAKCRIKDGL